MTRQDILYKIIDEQRKVIENLEQSVQRYKTASDIDEDSTLDPEDFSHQSEAKDMQLRFESMLRDAQSDLEFLQKETEGSHHEIESGCIIDTDGYYLFIGLSMPQFKINNKEVLCISEDAPIFQELEDKKVGDTVNLGNRSLEIKAFM